MQSINIIQNYSQIKIVSPQAIFNEGGGNVGIGSTSFQG